MTNNNAGFTLIEILIAVVILAAALFVLIAGQTTSVSTLDLAREKVLERNLIEQVIGRAEAGLFSGQMTESGEFNKRYEGYKWSYEATLVGDEYSPLYEVLVRIQPPEGEPIEMNIILFAGNEYTPDGLGAGGAPQT